MVRFIGMVGQPHRNFMKMASWSSVSEHLVNPIGMSDQLKWNNQIFFTYSKTNLNPCFKHQQNNGKKAVTCQYFKQRNTILYHSSLLDCTVRKELFSSNEQTNLRKYSIGICTRNYI